MQSAQDQEAESNEYLMGKKVRARVELVMQRLIPSCS